MAQQSDDQELREFLVDVNNLVGQVTGLSAQSTEGKIQQLISEAHHHYQQSSGLPGDQTRVKSALIKLITELTKLLISKNQDLESLQKIQRGQEQRLAHFTRLEYKLTGDIFRDQSPIEQIDLAPTLLSESSEAVETVLALFNQPQISTIQKDSLKLIAKGKSEGFDTAQAEQNLSIINKFAKH